MLPNEGHPPHRGSVGRGSTLSRCPLAVRIAVVARTAPPVSAHGGLDARDKPTGRGAQKRRSYPRGQPRSRRRHRSDAPGADGAFGSAFSRRDRTLLLHAPAAEIPLAFARSTL